MYVSEVSLWNFRKYGAAGSIDLAVPNLKVELTPGLNVLIGANDSGKTAIIDAIKLVLKTHSHEWITTESTDFFEDSKELRIEIICKDIADEEAKNFTEWLGWEGEGESAQPYLRLIYHVTRTEDRVMPSDVRAGADPIGHTMTAEAREYLKSTYLKPLRDAKSELVAKRNSRLSQIFRGHTAFKGKNKTHHLVASYEKLDKEIIEYFKGKEADGVRDHTDQKGKELKDKIDEFVRAFCGEDEISDIKASEGDLISILERLQIAMLNRLNPGLGTLNRLFMGTELVHVSKDPWTGLRVALVEELEAHLSPQAQMQVVEKLQAEENIQLILTTHSPNLASKVKLKNLILCVGDGAYAMGEEFTELLAEDYVFLEKFLDATKANLFFARGVILVEGWAEEILIPSLAKKLGFDLTKYGVSVVNVGSTAFLRYSKVFLRKDEDERIGIPVSVVTDVDAPAYTKATTTDDDGEALEYVKRNEEEVAQQATTNAHQLMEQYDKADVKSFIAPEWTLEYTLLKSDVLGPLFLEAVKAVHTRTDWETNPEASLARLLLTKSFKKTEIAYLIAQALDSSASPINNIELQDNAYYLLDAIKYACRVTDN